MKFAIIGAGHGGYAMSADLTLGGHEARLYELPQFPQNIAPVLERGGIKIVGQARTGFAEIRKATTDMKEAVQGVDIIMFTAPAFMHEKFVEKLLPHLEDGQIIVFNTGYWACMRFGRKLKETKDVTLAQTALLVYSCRREVGKAWVEVAGLKKNLLISAFPATDTKKVMDALEGGEVFGGHPKLIAAKNVLNIDLENLNNVDHPAIALSNITVIERTKGDFLFYKDGVTPAVGKLIDALDYEQAAVAKKLGIEKVSAKEWLHKYYGAKGRNTYEAYQNCKPFLVPSEKGPSNLSHRYITEDVPFGLVPTSSLGDLLGVPTPTMKAIIQFASIINDVDYWREGNTAEKMGLKGMTAEQIVRYATYGT